MEPIAKTSTRLAVEFFGVPRERCGVAVTEVRGGTLGEVLRELAERFPRFAVDCLTPTGQLNDAMIANIDGERFTRDPKTSLTGARSLIILSADAGG